MTKPGRESEEIVLLIEDFEVKVGMDRTAAVHEFGFCLGLLASDAVFGSVVLLIDEAIVVDSFPEFLDCFLMVRIGRTDEMNIVADTQKRQKSQEIRSALFWTATDLGTKLIAFGTITTGIGLTLGSTEKRQ